MSTPRSAPISLWIVESARKLKNLTRQLNQCLKLTTMNSANLNAFLHLANVQAATMCAIKFNEEIIRQLDADSSNDAKVIEQILQLLNEPRR